MILVLLSMASPGLTTHKESLVSKIIILRYLEIFLTNFSFNKHIRRLSGRRQEMDAGAGKGFYFYHKHK